MRILEPELIKLLPDGLPAISRYDEFLKITKEKDTPEMFTIWLQAAYTLMKASAGNS